MATKCFIEEAVKIPDLRTLDVFNVDTKFMDGSLMVPSDKKLLEMFMRLCRIL